MSLLGEFRRLPADLLEEIRATPRDAYDRLADLDDMLDLDRSWERLAKLIDRTGFPLNPITAGTPFPDEHHAFGRAGGSRALTIEEVAAAAERLSQVPFDVLQANLRPLLETEPISPQSFESQMLGWPFDPRLDVNRLKAEREQAVRITLAGSYSDLVRFFCVAAEKQDCTVFWVE
ncbi:DUF1877 family protein [Actinoplanes sp. NEAU-A12]|uniref:DUF1877 family protein n=1 Tax=Actinoplanes sandaracinus TaxID=3045177 RepID=A0ABT6WW46_9ACTN|nr:DUF1877 family protein [Actinoplanes sandaracinus]MDI6103851.1 DUF1877 family protein [Actinoplanes sandaracinus]